MLKRGAQHEPLLDHIGLIGREENLIRREEVPPHDVTIAEAGAKVESDPPPSGGISTPCQGDSWEVNPIPPLGKDTSEHSNMLEKKVRTMPPITFTDEDFKASDPDDDDPTIISIKVAEYGIGKVLVDQGSSVNILY